MSDAAETQAAILSPSSATKAKAKAQPRRPLNRSESQSRAATEAEAEAPTVPAVSAAETTPAVEAPVDTIAAASIASKASDDSKPISETKSVDAPAPAPSAVASTAPASSPSASPRSPSESKEPGLAPRYSSKSLKAKATLPGEKFLNIIDGDGRFVPTAEEISATMTRGKLTDKYCLVGIMGVQSSGKSTLLNLLFGTSFREMNAHMGRSQTTLGIWLDSAEAKDVAVMDLEGTDSGERGEDRTTFERQTTLFALALVEVLIVNMWEHDIGRYTASNYGVLKTVFEVNLQLFNNPSKTLILFVVRDHTGDTPEEVLKRKLFAEVEKIWGEIEKPDQFKSAPLSDFFDFEFFALPHKRLQANEFTAAVNDLRSRFLEPASPHCYFNRPYHLGKTVPKDGFGKYAQNIWEAIKASKELNLPSQQEMLAIYRCEEICRDVLELFEDEVSALLPRVEKALVPELGSQLTQAADLALHTYDASAGKYMQAIAKRKRGELFDKMASEAEKLFRLQMEHAYKAALAQFDSTLAEALRSPDASAPVCSASFDTHVTAALQAAAQQLTTSFVDSELADAHWEVEPFQARLADETKAHVSRQKQVQLDNLKAESARLTESELKGSLPPVLADITRPPLQRVQSRFRRACGLVLVNANKKLSGFAAHLSEQDRNESLQSLAAGVRSSAITLLRQEAALLPQKLRKRFDRKFRLDSEGLPRKWRAQHDVRGMFAAARRHALVLLDWHAVAQLPEWTDKQIAELARGPVPVVVDEPVSHAPRPKKAAEPAGPAAPQSVMEQLAATMQQLAESAHAETGLADMEEDEPVDSAAVAKPQDPGAVVIVDAGQREKLEEQFQEDVVGALREVEAELAKFEQNTRLPAWAMLLFVLLGFDEIMSVLRSPLLLLLSIVVGFGGYTLYTARQFAPTRLVVDHALRKFSELASAKLKQWFEGTVQQAAAMSGKPNPAANASASTAKAPATPRREDQPSEAATPSSASGVTRRRKGAASQKD